MPKRKRHKQQVRKWVGIDPGTQGGIACIGVTGDVRVIAMPETEREILIALTGVALDAVCCLEQVSAFVGSAAKSAFTFGQGYGALRMALIACRIPFTNPTPSEWHRGLHITAKRKRENDKAFKRRKLRIAKEMYPDLPAWEESETFQLKVCESLLLAHYCKQQWRT